MEQNNNVNDFQINAGYKKRIFAFIIDLSIAAIASIIPFYILNINNITIDYYYVMCILFYLVSLFAYLQSGDRTPGMNMLRIRVLKEKTMNPSKPAAITRLTIILIYMLLLYVDTLNGVILMLLMIIPAFFLQRYKDTKRLFWDTLSGVIIVEVNSR